MNSFKNLNMLSTLVLVLSISACGNSDDDDSIEDVLDQADNAITIDATAGGVGASTSDPANKYTYFDLDTGSVVELTDAQAETDTVWDIAFKRTKTRINGGASGPGNVTAALADAQQDYYDASDEPIVSVFNNATAETEQPAFDNFTDASSLVFEADQNQPKIDGSLLGEDSWALYNPANHSISAQSDAWNIIKSADGTVFAKLHVTDIVQASRDITVEMFIQQNGGSSFDTTATTWTASIGADGGSLCFDFDTESEVDCITESGNWDLMVEVSANGFEWNMWTNGGVYGDSSGGAYGTIQTADFDYDGVGNGDGLLPSRYLEADGPTGVFLDNSWYAYGINATPSTPDHNLYPNYRVYALDVDGVIYKLQYLSYYNEADVSGNITIRFEAL